MAFIKADMFYVRGVLFLVLLMFSNCRCYNGLESISAYYGLATTAAARNETVCQRQFATIARGIENHELWAMKLMDSSGAPSSKIFWGNTFWPGSLKQCRAAGYNTISPNSPSARGSALHHPHALPPFPVHYYGANFRHDSPIMIPTNFDSEYVITLGLCIPESCKEAEISNLLQEYFDSDVFFFQALYNTTLKMESVLKTKSDYSWIRSQRFIFFTSTSLLIIGACCLGTYYEVKISQNMSGVKSNGFYNNGYSNEAVENDGNGRVSEIYTNGKKEIMKHSFLEKLLLCFSYKSNWNNLFDTDIKGDGYVTLMPFFGLRTIMQAWIIMNHTVLYTIDMIHNRGFCFSSMQDISLQVFVNSTYFVDSFITMGGFLLGYAFLDMEKKKQERGIKETAIKKISFIFLGVFQRFLRLTPAYMVALGLSEFTAKWRREDTILWYFERNDDYCEKFWWRNLLYVNNLFPRQEICMSWSWFLSNDMQMFVISICLLALSTSYFKFSLGVLITLIFTSNLYVGLMTYVLEFLPFLDSMWKNFDIFYSPPWTRFGGYGIGLAAGYMMRHLNGKLPLSENTIKIGWYTAVGILASLMLGFSDRKMPLWGSALYMALARPAWGAGISILLVTCISGHGGKTAEILSAKFWIPFARVTYSCYLIHPILIRTIGSFYESGIEMVIPNMVILGTGYIVASFAASILFSLTFESPLIKVAKLMLERSNSSEKRPKENKSSQETSCKTE